jgi:hypothetical protein
VSAVSFSVVLRCAIRSNMKQSLSIGGEGMCSSLTGSA